MDSKIKDYYQSEHCPEEFLECDVLYQNYWSDYEENGWIIIFKFFDEIMVWNYESCVFAEDNSVVFDPYPISEFKMQLLQKDWDKKCDDNHRYMSNSGGF
jgi:hypothetical protein